MSILSRPAKHTNKSHVKINRATRKKLARRQRFMEKLEDRVLLSYGFTYNTGTKVATATGNAASDSLVLEPIGGFVEYSVDGSAFSANWGGNAVPTSPSLVIDIFVSTDDGSSLTLGTPSGPISNILGTINVSAQPNTTDSVTLDDSAGTKDDSAGNPYTIDTVPGTVTGNGFIYNESASQAFEGGITLLGSSQDGDVYNVNSVAGPTPNEAFTIVTSKTGSSTVNVGTGTLDINSPLAIYSATTGTTINVNDSSDTLSGTATFDDSSGNSNAPYELTGLSAGPIEFGSGVTAVNVSGGSDAGSGITYDINDTPAGTTTTIDGGADMNTINLSSGSESGGLNNLLGPVVVNGGSSNSDDVNLVDSDSDGNYNYTVTGTTVTQTGDFAGLTYGNIGELVLRGTDGTNDITIDSTANGVTNFIDGNGGADTYDVEGTGTGGTLNISGGFDSGNTMDVVADSEPVNLTFDAGSSDQTVNIGSTGGAGDMTQIQGAIGLLAGPGTYTLNIDDSNDTTGQTFTLNNNDAGSMASVQFSSGATTSYRPQDINSLTINGGSGGNTFNVNNTTALAATTLNTGNGDDSVNVYKTGDNTLTVNGEDGQDEVALGGVADIGMQDLSGVINLSNSAGFDDATLDDSEDVVGQAGDLSDDGTTGTVTELSPATINYPDTDLSSLTIDASTAGDNSIAVNGILSDVFDSPTFTTIDTGGSSGNNIYVNSTTAGGILEITDPGGMNNTVTFDANAETPTIIAGGAADEVQISIPSQGIVDITDYQTVDVVNIAPVLITPGSSQTIDATEGNALSGVIVGNFTFPIPEIGSVPIGVPASDFTATIDWGDGTSVTAGTILQDGSNPSLYDITGSHTYASDGTFTVGNTVNFPINTFSSTLNGVLVTVDLAGTGPTDGTAGSADVIHATLPVTVNALTGTEGLQHPAGAIGTFIDNGGPHAVGGYSAQITITNSLEQTIINVAATSITQIGSSNEFTINAPAFTLPEEGTYTVSVAVTEDDSVDADPYTSTGTGTDVVSDAALTASSTVDLSVNTGAAITNTVVGNFNDANPAAPIGDFTATIDWGDGTTTTGTIVQPGGVGTVFKVEGTHAYALPSDYTISIHVVDDGGSTVNLSGGADVTDLPVTGSVSNFHAIENLNTGTIVLATFTDPNPLATVSSVTATLPAGGWGDGTPPVAVPLTIVQTGGTSTTTTFEVTGSHTYTSNGDFPVNITITTSGGAVTNLTTGSATVPNPNTILVFKKQPANVIAGNFLKPVVIDLNSLANKLMKNDNDQITISVASGPDGDIGGSTTVSAVNGVATFSNLILYTTGTYTLIATDGGVTVVSKTFKVSPAALDFMEIDDPSNVTAGQTEAGINVYLFDDFDNLITAKQSVTLSLNSGPSGGGIVGSLKATASGGIATFKNISFDVAGTYSVRASVGGIFENSSTFTVSPAAAAVMAFQTKPSTVAAGSPINGPIVVQVTDKFGNLLTNNNNNVGISVLTGPNGGSLGGTTFVELIGGVASFTNLDLTTPGNYALLLTFGGLSQEMQLTVT
jgi:large repetitive protein